MARAHTRCDRLADCEFCGATREHLDVIDRDASNCMYSIHHPCYVEDRFKKCPHCGCKLRGKRGISRAEIAKLNHAVRTDAARGDLGAVILSYRKGAEFSSQSDTGNKMHALHCAAMYGHIEIVLFLLHHGVPVDILADQDWTPLHVAATRGQTEVVCELVRHGADIHYSDCEGRTPLHKAAAMGHLECLEHLLDLGGNPDKRDISSGWTPRHDAAFHDHLECLKTLLSCPRDILEGDKNNYTLLHLAAAEGHLSMVKYLCQSLAGEGMDFISLQTNRGENVIEVPRRLNKLAVVAYLEQFYTDWCNKREIAMYPLHAAAICGDLSFLKVQKEEGRDFHGLDSAGCTLLHRAAENGHLDVVLWLLDLDNFQCALRNGAGHTAVEVANQNNHPECADAIMQYLEWKAREQEEIDDPTVFQRREQATIDTVEDELRQLIAQFHRLGGQLPGDIAKQEERQQYLREVSDLEYELKTKRLRREQLEATLDSVRSEILEKVLAGAVSRLEREGREQFAQRTLSITQEMNLSPDGAVQSDPSTLLVS